MNAWNHDEVSSARPGSWLSLLVNIGCWSHSWLLYFHFSQNAVTPGVMLILGPWTWILLSSAILVLVSFLDHCDSFLSGFSVSSLALFPLHCHQMLFLSHRYDDISHLLKNSSLRPCCLEEKVYAHKNGLQGGGDQLAICSWPLPSLSLMVMLYSWHSDLVAVS